MCSIDNILYNKSVNSILNIVIDKLDNHDAACSRRLAVASKNFLRLMKTVDVMSRYCVLHTKSSLIMNVNCLT